MESLVSILASTIWNDTDRFPGWPPSNSLEIDVVDCPWRNFYKLELHRRGNGCPVATVRRVEQRCVDIFASFVEAEPGKR